VAATARGRRRSSCTTSEADIASIHCPLAAETAGKIAARRIGLLREGAVHITTAREVAVGMLAFANLRVFFAGDPLLNRIG